MDNIIIVRESATRNQPLLIGNSDKADMTLPEFLEACRLAGLSFDTGSLTLDGKDAVIWPHF
jgi:hypothetical protein